MSLRRRLALALIALAVAGAPARAEEAKPKEGAHAAKTEEPPPEPMAIEPHPISDLIDELQQTQLRMANGDKSAYARQSERLRAIGEAIASAKPEVWKSRSEIEAAAAYVLSGGSPRAITQLLERGVTPKDGDALLRGALAYAAGRVRDAEALLAPIDPKTVSLRLGGQLAYAKSVLATSSDPDEAIRYLDLARLLAPGSLVEEAALRREILLAGDRHDGDRMIFLARQYAGRFPKSIYASDFISSLSVVSVRYGLIEDVANLRKFEELLSLVTAEQRRAFLLTIARNQLIGGKFEVAGAAAAYVLGSLTPDDADAARARFYAAAAKIVGDDYAASFAELQTLDKSKLGKADRALLPAVLHVATHLRDRPSDAQFAEAGREDHIAALRSPDPVPPHPNDPVANTIEQARGALASSDELIRLSKRVP